MLAGSHRNAWPDETGTGGRTNRNTQQVKSSDGAIYTWAPRMGQQVLN